MCIIILWDQQAPQGLQMPVARAIAQVLVSEVEVHENPVTVRGYDRQRNQHNARKILDDLQDYYTRQYGSDKPVLLVVRNDIYIPGKDFVFGLARQDFNVSVISTARLQNGFYGRRASDDDAIDRITKEGAHELGHLMGLDHCTQPECIMYCPQTLDDLDRKKKAFCNGCEGHLAAGRI